MSDTEALERLSLQLQGMRFGLEQFSTGDRSTWPDATERRSQLLDRYDAALVVAAEVLGVEAPDPPPRAATEPRRLDDEGRARLEGALRVAGLDL